MQVLRTQWDEDEKEKVEFKKWREDKNNIDYVVDGVKRL